MEPLIGMGVLALMGAAATIAGASEDLESTSVLRVTRTPRYSWHPR